MQRTEHTTGTGRGITHIAAQFPNSVTIEPCIALNSAFGETAAEETAMPMAQPENETIKRANAQADFFKSAAGFWRLKAGTAKSCGVHGRPTGRRRGVFEKHPRQRPISVI